MEYETSEGIIFRHGRSPVVLACGHDGQQVPEGVAMRYPNLWDRNFNTTNDQHTMAVTMGLAEKLEAEGVDPNVVIFTVPRAYIDPNRMRPLAYDVPRREASKLYTAYHAKIRQICKKLRNGILLDIHGTVRSEADIFLGTCYGNSVASIWTEKFLGGLLSSRGWRVWFNHPRLSGGYTVLLHGYWSGGLDAVQVELAKPLRFDVAIREKVVTDLACATASLVRSYQALEFGFSGGGEVAACS